MNTPNKNPGIRERIFKKLFLFEDAFRTLIRWLYRICNFSSVSVLLLSIVTILLYFGFHFSTEVSMKLQTALKILFFILFFSKFLSEILRNKKKKLRSSFFLLLIFVFSFAVFLSNSYTVDIDKKIWAFFFGNTPIIVAILLITLSEISVLSKLINAIKVPPALLFSSSFLVIILIGAGFLMFPNTHTVPLSFLDCLFTATSAVCVTGLVVVDTATTFTLAGKIVILCLIQIGGLGIMTFTGLFSYIFTSSSSFRDKLLLKEIFSSESIDNMFKVLAKIVLLTFLTEAAGALLIYSNVDPYSTDKILFSVFHSISAFCNAGFSTLSDGLFSVSIRDNAGIQVPVALLIILGGIGFPLLLNLYLYLKHFIRVIPRIIKRKPIPSAFIQKNISDHIVLTMTTILILSGTVLYYLFEKNNSLDNMDNIHKIIASFFSNVSARTAGFNITDISQWSYLTIFLMIFLMWIGASPGSTGGGIKTTTFAIAFLSAWNSIRGNQHFVIGNREISSNNISRVLAIIFLSIIVITTGFFCLLITEPGNNPIYLLFECVSAYGTVGLSLANTQTFSDGGKIIVIFMMFIGRVGPLTLFTGLLLSSKKRYSRYPEIEISIN